jgi:HEAT repeat protein
MLVVHCTDANRYEVFVRPGWDADGATRQTRLRPLIEVDAAMRGLDAPAPAARRDAAEALARLGPEATAAAGRLGEAVVGDEDAAVRAEAATALGRLGVRDEVIVQALRRATVDPSPVVRERAAEALAALGGG